jgi:hypothetical protein
MISRIAPELGLEHVEEKSTKGLWMRLDIAVVFPIYIYKINWRLELELLQSMIHFLEIS